jgi:hypothetical protein
MGFPQMHMKNHHEFEALEELTNCMTRCGCGFVPDEVSNIPKSRCQFNKLFYESKLHA